jgi:hypothetical protein
MVSALTAIRRLSLTLAAMLLCALGTGCAQMGEQLPTNFGGLPADTPQRPQVMAPTPAVHDVPPARPVPPLNDAEQLRLEKDLAAARARQGKLQDPNARKHAEDANAASAAALERAKAAAKPPPP